MHAAENPILDSELSRTVVSVLPGDEEHDAAVGFLPRHEVYDMAAFSGPGSTWAEYAGVFRRETAIKPKRRNWVESASVPISTMTTWKALFGAGSTP